MSKLVAMLLSGMFSMAMHFTFVRQVMYSTFVDSLWFIHDVREAKMTMFMILEAHLANSSLGAISDFILDLSNIVGLLVLIYLAIRLTQGLIQGESILSLIGCIRRHVLIKDSTYVISSL